MSRDAEAWTREFDRLCERLLVAERTLELLHAVDAHDLMERPARVLRCLIELSYGQGLTSVRVESRRKLAALVGFGESKMGEALDELVAGQMLQIYPDTKVYEVLPNWQKWRARPRCRFGLDGAAELSAQILADDQRRRGEQIEFAEQERSFAPDTTLQEAAGQLAREEAGLPPEPVFTGWTEQQPGSRATGAGSLPPPSATPADLFSSGPDARENRSEPNPSAIINGAATAAGPRLRLSEAVRQSPGFTGRPKLPGKGSSDCAAGESTAPKLPEKGSSSADDSPKLPGKGSFSSSPTPDATPKLPGKGSFGTPPNQKLPGKGSFGGQGGPKAAQNFPEREVSSRARASDDHHQSSSGSSSVLPSKQRFSSDDHPDEEEPEADDRSGAEEKGEGMMMVPVHDEVFGDIQRKLGVEGMLSFSTFWRAAIFASRSAAVHALDQVKYADRRIPGGYMRRCFYTECAKRGVRLRHPELVAGIPRELRGLKAVHPQPTR